VLNLVHGRFQLCFGEAVHELLGLGSCAFALGGPFIEFFGLVNVYLSGPSIMSTQLRLVLGRQHTTGVSNSYRAFHLS